jgi:hypothetical protein
MHAKTAVTGGPTMIFHDDWISDSSGGRREPKRIPVDQIPNLVSVANDTKWRELRTAILGLEGANPPSFRCMNVETGRLGPWDSEWFYHWLHGGWEWMEWVELLVHTPQQRDAVRAILKQIRFAGEETAEGFRIYGYIRTGQTVSYIE